LKTTPHLPYIYAVLFDRIVSGEYPPNTRLKEEELAARFEVSRTPIRLTLRQLEQDGLIEILPNRGARVVGFTVDDVEEVYDIRKSLEIQALKTSAPHLNIQGLLEIRAKLQEVSRIKDEKVHEEIDAQVHNYFIQASGKRRLVSILNQMFRLIQRFRELGFKDPDLRESAYEAHLALIDAICLRDVNKATEILSEHIEQSKLHAVSYIVKKSGASGWEKKASSQ
jgi:DNA-binding GntR family transcriptional regulator